MDGRGRDSKPCEALEALSVEPGRRPSQQSINAAEEWISIEDDQEAVEAIRLDCQDELIGDDTDDGECGGGESSKSAGSKRQDSGDTVDDLGLGDTEGPESLEDFSLTPFAEIAESLSILEAVAEKSLAYHKLLFISFGRRRWHSI